MIGDVMFGMLEGGETGRIKYISIRWGSGAERCTDAKEARWAM